MGLAQVNFHQFLSRNHLSCPNNSSLEYVQIDDWSLNSKRPWQNLRICWLLLHIRGQCKDSRMAFGISPHNDSSCYFSHYRRSRNYSHYERLHNQTRAANSSWCLPGKQNGNNYRLQLHFDLTFRCRHNGGLVYLWRWSSIAIFLRRQRRALWNHSAANSTIGLQRCPSRLFSVRRSFTTRISPSGLLQVFCLYESPQTSSPESLSFHQSWGQFSGNIASLFSEKNLTRCLSLLPRRSVFVPHRVGCSCWCEYELSIQRAGEARLLSW